MCVFGPKAPEAQPNTNTDESDMSAVKLDFKFGMRKRRKVHTTSSPVVKSQPNASITTNNNSPEEQRSRDASRHSSPYMADDGDCGEEMKTNSSGDLNAAAMCMRMCLPGVVMVITGVTYSSSLLWPLLFKGNNSRCLVVWNFFTDQILAV